MNWLSISGLLSDKIKRVLYLFQDFTCCYMFMQDVSEESRTKRLWLESSAEINDASVIGFLFE